MAKIMEIIERKIDFRKQTASLTLLDSNFQTLSKKLGSVTGRTMLNTQAGQYVGYQLAADIQTRQLGLYNNLNTWRTGKFTPEITRYRNAGMSINSFNMTISAPAWASKYNAESPADFDFLTDILNYENTLRRFTSDVASHIGHMLTQAKEWAKQKPYLSSLNYLTLGTGTYNNHNWKMMIGSTLYSLESWRSGGNSYGKLTKSLINTVPIGTDVILYVYTQDEKFRFPRFTLRTSNIENDKTWTLTPYGISGIGNAWVDSQTPNATPCAHFVDPTGKNDLNFIKTRTLL